MDFKSFIKSPMALAIISGTTAILAIVILIISILSPKEPTSPTINEPVSSEAESSSSEVSSEEENLLVSLDVAVGTDYLDIGICRKGETKRLEGIDFSVSVKKDSEKEKNYDSNGKNKIVISSLLAGNYTVTLNQSDEFDILNGTVQVKIEKIEYKENIIEEIEVVDKNKTDEEDPMAKPNIKEEEPEETPEEESSSSEGSSSTETESDIESKFLFTPPVTTEGGDFIYDIISKNPVSKSEFQELIKEKTETKIYFNNKDEAAEKALLALTLANEITPDESSAPENTSSEAVDDNNFLKENDYLWVKGYIISTEIHIKGLLAETATEIAVSSKGETFVLKVKAITEGQDFTEGFFTKDNKTYYLKADATLATNWYNINLRRHYFSDKGVLSSVHGVDVSSYQGKVSWDKVASDNIEFAIIRAGFRGYETGVNKIDSYCEDNIKGAKAAGLDVGLYFFSQAITVSEAAEEASILIDLAKKYNVTMPLAIDVELIGESTARADGLTAAQRTTIVKAFCETVKNAGFEPMVYTGQKFYSQGLIGSELTDYKLWIARYPADAKLYETPNISAKYLIWQYASDGKVSGIKGNVDMNSMIIG